MTHDTTNDHVFRRYPPSEQHSDAFDTLEYLLHEKWDTDSTPACAADPQVTFGERDDTWVSGPSFDQESMPSWSADTESFTLPATGVSEETMYYPDDVGWWPENGESFPTPDRDTGTRTGTGADRDGEVSIPTIFRPDDGDETGDADVTYIHGVPVVQSDDTGRFSYTIGGESDSDGEAEIGEPSEPAEPSTSPPREPYVPDPANMSDDAIRTLLASFLPSSDIPDDDDDVRDADELPDTCERGGKNACGKPAEVAVRFVDPDDLVAYCGDCADDKIEDHADTYAGAYVL